MSSLVDRSAAVRGSKGWHASRLRGAIGAAVLCGLAAAATACGSTAITSVGPSPAKCEISLPTTSRSIGSGGGPVTVSITTEPECPWSASTEADWIAKITPASGQGPGSIRLDVARNTGPRRTGTLLIEGKPFTVVQSDGCQYAVTPTTMALDAAGGAGNVAVTAGAGCAWSAATGADWIAVSPASGNGDGSVSLAVAANFGPARTATVAVAGRVVTVTQASGCTYAVSPLEHLVHNGGGTRVVAVNTAAGCTWTARSNSE